MVDRHEVETRFRKLVMDHLVVEVSKVVPGAEFRGELGADSLDVVELVMSAEEEFGIDIDNDAYLEIHTVKDAEDLIFKIIQERR